MKRISIKKRLQEKIEVHMCNEEWFDGCWEWKGCRNELGYGTLWDDGRMKKAHRVSYEVYVGAIPDGKKVLHSCHNRWCVNPGHLRTGTQKENVRDMIEAGRAKFQK